LPVEGIGLDVIQASKTEGEYAKITFALMGNERIALPLSRVIGYGLAMAFFTALSAR
jgi:hypothetical protein